MRSFISLLAATTLAANPYNSPYSCHKPTIQELYARDKHCFAVLTADLKFVPRARFTHAGIDPIAVDSASTETMNRAYTTGEGTGLSPYAVYEDLNRATAAYINGHTRRRSRSGTRTYFAPRDDLSECVADVFGRPND